MTLQNALSQFSCSGSRDTFGTYANARTLTGQPAVGAPAMTTIIRLTPNGELLNDTSERTWADLVYQPPPDIGYRRGSCVDLEYPPQPVRDNRAGNRFGMGFD